MMTVPGARTGVWKSFTKLHPRLVPLALYLSLGLMATAQAAAPVAEKDSSGMAGRLDRIERQLQSQGLLDLARQIQTLQQEVNKLRGEIEVQSHTIEQMKERERALHADMDKRLQTLESGAEIPAAANAEGEAEATTKSSEPPLENLSGVNADEEAPAGNAAESSLKLETVGSAAGAATASVASAGTVAENAVEAASGLTAEPAAGTVATAAGAATPDMASDTVAAATDGASDQADYDRAFWLLKRAQHAEAIKAFRDYRANWPKGKFSDNAQYWLGEGYHATQKYEQALIEYERLLAEFPKSQKVTHAMLKSGYCLQEIGRTDEARARLSDLVRRYPGTTAARLAEERLRTLAAVTPKS